MSLSNELLRYDAGRPQHLDPDRFIYLNLSVGQIQTVANLSPWIGQEGLEGVRYQETGSTNVQLKTLTPAHR